MKHIKMLFLLMGLIIVTRSWSADERQCRKLSQDLEALDQSISELEYQVDGKDYKFSDLSKIHAQSFVDEKAYEGIDRILYPLGASPSSTDELLTRQLVYRVLGKNLGDMNIQLNGKKFEGSLFDYYEAIQKDVPVGNDPDADLSSFTTIILKSLQNPTRCNSLASELCEHLTHQDSIFSSIAAPDILNLNDLITYLEQPKNVSTFSTLLQNLRATNIPSQSFLRSEGQLTEKEKNPKAYQHLSNEEKALALIEILPNVMVKNSDDSIINFEPIRDVGLPLDEKTSMLKSLLAENKLTYLGLIETFESSESFAEKKDEIMNIKLPNGSEYCPKYIEQSNQDLAYFLSGKKVITQTEIRETFQKNCLAGSQVDKDNILEEFDPLYCPQFYDYYLEEQEAILEAKGKKRGQSTQGQDTDPEPLQFTNSSTGLQNCMDRSSLAKAKVEEDRSFASEGMERILASQQAKTLQDERDMILYTGLNTCQNKAPFQESRGSIWCQSIHAQSLPHESQAFKDLAGSISQLIDITNPPVNYQLFAKYCSSGRYIPEYLELTCELKKDEMHDQAEMYRTGEISAAGSVSQLREDIQAKDKAQSYIKSRINGDTTRHIVGGTSYHGGALVGNEMRKNGLGQYAYAKIDATATYAEYIGWCADHISKTYLYHSSGCPAYRPFYSLYGVGTGLNPWMYSPSYTLGNSSYFFDSPNNTYYNATLKLRSLYGRSFLDN